MVMALLPVVNSLELVEKLFQALRLQQDPSNPLNYLAFHPPFLERGRREVVIIPNSLRGQPDDYLRPRLTFRRLAMISPPSMSILL